MSYLNLELINFIVKALILTIEVLVLRRIVAPIICIFSLLNSTNLVFKSSIHVFDWQIELIHIFMTKLILNLILVWHIIIHKLLSTQILFHHSIYMIFQRKRAIKILSLITFKNLSSCKILFLALLVRKCCTIPFMIEKLALKIMTLLLVWISVWSKTQIIIKSGLFIVNKCWDILLYNSSFKIFDWSSRTFLSLSSCMPWGSLLLSFVMVSIYVAPTINICVFIFIICCLI